MANGRLLRLWGYVTLIWLRAAYRLLLLMRLWFTMWLASTLAFLPPSFYLRVPISWNPSFQSIFDRLSYIVC